MKMIYEFRYYLIQGKCLQLYNNMYEELCLLNLFCSGDQYNVHQGFFTGLHFTIISPTQNTDCTSIDLPIRLQYGVTF